MKPMNSDLVKDLYERFGFVIFSRCRHILRNTEDSRDAMHEVFMKFVEQYETIRDKEKLVPWLYSASTNYCFNVLRKKKRFSSEVTAEDTQSPSDTEHELSTRQIIKAALDFHDRKVREAVYYTYVEKLTQEEIQQVTGMSAATTRRHLRKFEQSLPNIRKRLGIS
jgi:RNA polymerase sigma-70 factor (ECF subfamily)